jgi:hypothetical protein
MLDDRAIAQLPVNSTDDEQRSHVEVPLTNPRSGAFQLVARFTVPQSRAVTESRQSFTVPLITPTGVAPEHHRLAVQSETAVRIAPSEEAWEVSDEPITSISPPGHPAAHFKALRRATEITLAERPEEPRNLANTVVHRAWIQTWISGSIRQDRTTYQFTTTSEQMQLQLPHEVPPTNVEIRLDHQLLAAPDSSIVIGVSINDLRKNLRDLNEVMDRECLSAEARYGITFDASLITGIDPPPEVESALAAINTAHNHVSSDISLAQASADQKIVQSHRAVEIETLKAQAEVEPLKALAAQLSALKRSGPNSLAIYMRNVRLRLYSQAQRIIMEVKE